MKKKLKLPNKIVVASFNTGKIPEIKQLFGENAIKFLSISEFIKFPPEENGKSFKENSLIKARNAYQKSGIASIADDSGLCVKALQGEPGIHSARWAGRNKNFYNAMKTIEKKLHEHTDKRACFICCLSLILSKEQEFTFQGRVNGKLTFPPRGKNGFGYDPIFIPTGKNNTFGEMDPIKKEAISHRFEAFKKLKETFVV